MRDLQNYAGNAQNLIVEINTTTIVIQQIRMLVIRKNLCPVVKKVGLPIPIPFLRLKVILIGFSSHSFELSQCSFILALMRQLTLQLSIEPCATAVHQILFKFHLSFELCSGNGVADRFCFALNFFLRKRNLLLNALEIKTELCNFIKPFFLEVIATRHLRRVAFYIYA